MSRVCVRSLLCIFTETVCMCVEGGVPIFKCRSLLKPSESRIVLRKMSCYRFCQISCDPPHQIQQYYQLWVTVRSVLIWYLSQNLTCKSAKMCNANMCHLTPQSQVWIPVRRSGAALTSDLWVSHVSVSSSSEHGKSLLGGRKNVHVCEKWTGVYGRPRKTAPRRC